MEKIYIALISTPGFFAEIIRKVIKLNYCHVAISMDSDFTEGYTVGRRMPAIPLIAGFTRENAQEILQVFPEAEYRIISLNCTSKQKRELQQELIECYVNRFKYHYCVIGLLFLLMNKSFYQKNCYTCSSFLAKLLEERGISLFSKHFSLVTPRDFYELQNTKVEYEGKFSDYVRIGHPQGLAGSVYGT